MSGKKTEKNLQNSEGDFGMKSVIAVLVCLAFAVPSISQNRILVRYKGDRNFRAVDAADGSKELRRLLKRTDVLWAERDKRVKHDALPNDPMLSQEWHLSKTQTLSAWNTTSGVGVVIAILDTGCDPAHTDLLYVPGWNQYDGNSNTTDVYGHGTAVAGTAAGVGNNAIGVAGIAFAAKIMPIRISGLDGYANYSTASTGLRWAADRGAKVANISYQMSESYAVSDSARYFQSKGGVVAISAGNAGQLLTALDSPYILTVGSSGQSDGRSGFSNYGSIVDLYAPGEGILSTNRGGGFGSWSGTSFSSPIVAGVAALTLASHPGVSGAQVQDIVKSAVDAVSAGNRVNAQKAVSSVAEPPPPVPVDTEPPVCMISSPATGSTVPNKPTMSIHVSASDNVGVVRVDLYIDGTLVGSDIGAPWLFTVNTKRWSSGTHTILVRATDIANNIGVSSAISVTK